MAGMVDNRLSPVATGDKADLFVGNQKNQYKSHRSGITHQDAFMV